MCDSEHRSGRPGFHEKNMHHEGPDSGQVPEFLALGSQHQRIPHLKPIPSLGSVFSEDATGFCYCIRLLVRWGEDIMFRLLPPESHLFSAHHFPVLISSHFTQRAQLAPDCCQPGPPRAAPSSPSQLELCAQTWHSWSAPSAPHKSKCVRGHRHWLPDSLLVGLGGSNFNLQLGFCRWESLPLVFSSPPFLFFVF